MFMNSCGILSNPWLVSQLTPPFLDGTVCREIGASRFVASTTIVAFPGFLRVGFLNFFCTSRWVLMRMPTSLCLPMSVHRRGYDKPRRRKRALTPRQLRFLLTAPLLQEV